MKTASYLITILVLVLFAMPSFGQGEEEAVRETFESLVAAIEAGDLETAVSLYAEN